MQLERFNFNINTNDNDYKCGSLIALEESRNIPFEIKRVYYIYGVNSSDSRGAHAHKESNQMLICVHGSCEILLDDAKVQKRLILDKPDMGLFQKKMIWGEMQNFSKDCVLMVLSDDFYSTDDYIRDYDQFLELAKVAL